MARLNREVVLGAAFELLNEVGIDQFSTRHLARRLNVEQPALYWHFKSKADLMSAMAEAAMAQHRSNLLPELDDDWRQWFTANMKNFRIALLAHRDGARLHAGTRPHGTDLERLELKLAFLCRAAGLSYADARTGMLAASRYTVGSVLEEQADYGGNFSADEFSHIFNAGMSIFVEGLASKLR
ncbi:TetR/AcrR family transcriptional regulator C-terminal domain-containing protein [Pseudomonas sp. R76]|uniref:TetR/AcrR family transcriptional regulator C-terminal domain-containing protein n=1 Tax=Pseudomonas sp. R76 TaxID=1573711 RepID=UPI0013203A62|nr:TetR/AcrR family transcriptional regulator C-terminal domain-containing protein [Pseudomonas sp. R76]QHD06947.1 hypothetical protein PspR76_14955 [Pseudomonas sp. R76]